jgi:uncharacterized membrane protein
MFGALLIFPPLFLLTAQVLKYAALRMYVDVSHWLQLVQQIVTTGMPNVPNHAFFAPSTMNYLAVHFVPLIYFFAVPFAIVPHVVTLFALNIGILVSAVIPLFRIAQRHGGKRLGWLVSVLFLWYPTFQYTAMYEFEMLRFSIPILLWMVDAWERGRLRWFYVLALLATLVREEVGLTVAMFGFYLLLVERRRFHGFMTMMIGVVAFVVITSVVMPGLSSATVYEHVAAGGSFGSFGSTPLTIAQGILLHPIAALRHVADFTKLANIGMLFIPLLGIPLLAPALLLPAFPALGIALISDSVVHASYILYYVSSALPFIFIAFIHGWFKLTTWISTREERSGHGANQGTYRSMIAASLVAIMTSAVFFGPSPVSMQFWSPRFRPAPFRTQSFHWTAYRVEDRHRQINAVIQQIPQNAVVAAPHAFQSRLFSYRGAMVYPQLVSADGATEATYVLLDETNNGLIPESPAYVDETTMDIVRADTEHWALQVSSNGYLLYQRL